MSPAPTSQRRLALTLVAILLLAGGAGLASAGFGDPSTGAGGPTTFHDVYVGTKTWIYRDWAPAFDWGYNGTGEGCTTSTVYTYVSSYCSATPSTGDAVVDIVIPTTTSTLARDARAGVGYGYNLRTRCDGQDVNKLPFYVNGSYVLNPSFDVEGNGAAYVEVWGNALQGRGGATGEGTRTPAGPVGNTNTLLHTFNPPSFAGHAGDFDNTYLTTPLGEHAFLIYAKAHGETKPGLGAPATGSVWARGRLNVGLLEFNWPDKTAPTLDYEIAALDGSPLPPPVVQAPWTTEWYRQPVKVTFTVDDDFSCPKEVFLMNQQSYPVNEHKDPIVVVRDTDGFHQQNTGVRDWAENLLWFYDDFGIDRVAPSIEVSVDPATPTGQNGWWRGAAPSVVVGCSDAASGCGKTRWWWNSGPQDDKFTVYPQRFAAPNGQPTFHCVVHDRSALTNATGCDVTLKYDSVNPGGTVTCGPVGGSAGLCATSTSTAYSGAQRVRVSCTDASSGCWWLNHTLDQEAPVARENPVGDTVFDVISEGPHWVNVTRTDRAGNVYSTTNAFTLDSTPPTRPVVTETHGAPIISGTPTWTWTATDNLSGVARYEMYVNGAYYWWTPNPWFNHTTAKEGQNCMEVVALDKAGNPSAKSEPSCVLSDLTAPTLNLTDPRYNQVYKFGEPYVQQGSGWSIALGKVVMNLSAWDPGNALDGAGLARLWTLVDNANWTPLEGSSDCPATSAPCLRTYVPAPGAWGWRTFAAKASDLGGNVKTLTQRVDVVDLLVATGNEPVSPAAGGANRPYAHLDWVPYAGPYPFWGYDVHRGDAPGFTPTDLNKVAEIGSQSWNHYHDLSVLPSQQYHYVVVTHWKDWYGVIHDSSSVYYPAHTPSAFESPDEDPYVKPRL